MASKAFLALALSLGVAACSESIGQPVERLSFESIATGPHIQSSPDVTGAVWQRLAVGKGLRFGRPDQSPLFTVSCKPDPLAGAQMHVARFAPAEPGAKGMFALIGNGRVLRVKADAVQRGAAWRWEGAVPAQDIHAEVFGGYGPIEGTLPGAGTLKLAPSSEPAELLKACRQLAKQVAPAVPPA